MVEGDDAAAAADGAFGPIDEAFGPIDEAFGPIDEAPGPMVNELSPIAEDDCADAGIAPGPIDGSLDLLAMLDGPMDPGRPTAVEGMLTDVRLFMVGLPIQLGKADRVEVSSLMLLIMDNGFGGGMAPEDGVSEASSMVSIFSHPGSWSVRVKKPSLTIKVFLVGCDNEKNPPS